MTENTFRQSCCSITFNVIKIIDGDTFDVLTDGKETIRLANTRHEQSPMTPEQLKSLHQNAESTLRELMDILNHTPHLAAEIKPLMQSPDVLTAFQSLADDKPELAEQLFRLTLATTVNYHTSVEIGRQLAKGQN